MFLYLLLLTTFVTSLPVNSPALLVTTCQQQEPEKFTQQWQSLENSKPLSLLHTPQVIVDGSVLSRNYRNLSFIFHEGLIKGVSSEYCLSWNLQGEVRLAACNGEITQHWNFIHRDSTLRPLTDPFLCLTYYSPEPLVTYTNPIVNTDAPDPGVLYYGGYYYVVNTGGDGTNSYPIRRSTDLVNWQQIGWIFPNWKANKNPSWAASDFWAPELHLITDSTDPSQRRFNAYYSIRHTNGILSVGVATATAPEGPYKDIGKPLYQNASDGSIDASYFRDHNTQTPYVIYKVDGNADGHPTPIFAVPVSADGLSLTGNPTKLIQEDQSWEGNLVEGPWIFYHNNLQYYYLFYSANGYASQNYAVGVARSKAALGPYTKLGSNPILHTAAANTNPAWAGPGHCSVIGSKNNQTDIEIVYHAWRYSSVGTGGRMMLLDTVTFDTNTQWPSINNGANVPSQASRTINT